MQELETDLNFFKVFCQDLSGRSQQTKINGQLKYLGTHIAGQFEIKRTCVTVRSI